MRAQLVEHYALVWHAMPPVHRVLVFSARPSVVKATFGIDLPRPRPLAAKRQPALLGYVDAIWKVIEEEVKVS